MTSPRATAPDPTGARTRPDRLRAAGPGLVACLGIAAVATPLGRLVPVVGSPVIAIVLGVLLAVGVPVGRLRPGAAVAAGPALQLSVVLLGTGLSLTQVARTGVSSLPVLLGTLAVALGGARLAGRVLGVRGDRRTLIGVGTGICGASAIAAVTAVIGAAEVDVAYAVATIFTFNVAAVLLYPALGHLLGLSQHAFGLWAGTAINDTSSVVAAATSYGRAAGSYGVVVKLTRSLMIVPICLWLGIRSGRGAGERRALPWRRMFPPFLVGFLLASLLDTAGTVPAGWHGGLTATSTFLITAALAGIGLGTRPAALRAAGVRPLLLGGLLWVAVGASSLLLQLVTGSR
ncbi:MAG TPA: putative sulfate exporter family transporter [Jatrophihabitans sp.]|nr:putative sulfate exporter family transporter [Jatrophihabitans sp.]